MQPVKKLARSKDSSCEIAPSRSPINVQRLASELQFHPDVSFQSYLIDGFLYGFDTGLSSLPLLPYVCKNLLSAIKQPDITSQLIASELANGYLIGPFDAIPYSQYRISPVGIAEGKYSGKKRLIVDLSAPHENLLHPSLNDLIDKDEFSLTYTTIDNAIKVIKTLGRGAWLNKVDIRDAFKQIPIREELWPFHGIRWNNKYYFYTRLVFGSRSSPKIFDSLSRAICWILQNNYAVKYCLHLLDDFLTIDPPRADANKTMRILLSVFEALGVPLSPTKTVGPVNEIVYLGLILDAIRFETRLPVEKTERIASLLHSFSNRNSCTKRELLSLLGHLNYACRVIYPGRAFVSYLISLSASVKKLHHHVKLTAECKSDMRMWSMFLSQWNGVSMFMHDEITLADDMQLFTDATPRAFAGVYGEQWFQGEFPIDFVPSADVASMALYELYPIVMAAVLWGGKWAQKRIVVNCDNAATVDIINKGRSKVSFIQKFVRRLIWCAAKGQFFINAKHIPGRTNVIADALSRFNMLQFRRLAPNADREPVACLPVSELQMN